MATSRAATVSQYLEELPPERRADIEAVRRVVNDHLPKGYVESMGFGMITWSIPLATYPDTYNGQPLGVVALAAQKSHGSLYLMGCYGDPTVNAWFQEAWKKSGRKLDMGKSCVRFRRVEDLALDVIGQVIGMIPPAAFIVQVEEVRAAMKMAPTAKKKKKAAG